MQPIGRRPIIAVDRKTESKIEAMIEIFPPRPVDDGQNYFCLARIDGIEGASFDTGGVDGVQALALAIHTLKTEFESLNGTAYDFLWPDGTPMESIDYLPTL